MVDASKRYDRRAGSSVGSVRDQGEGRGGVIARRIGDVPARFGRANHHRRDAAAVPGAVELFRLPRLQIGTSATVPGNACGSAAVLKCLADGIDDDRSRGPAGEIGDDDLRLPACGSSARVGARAVPRETADAFPCGG